MPSNAYREACDASAAARIAGTDFFVAASDEDGILRVYDRRKPGPPVARTDVTAFLEPDDDDETEADLEGAAQIDDRIYWIGSHGRSKKGKERKIRQRFFATSIERVGDRLEVRPLNRPYKRLLRDLTSSPILSEFNLEAAAKLKPEEAGGLNVEGLAPTPEKHLLIGFRNPIPGGRALIVRLENPAALVDGTDTAAKLKVAGRLDLEGRGIRALEFVPSLEAYVIIAGSFGAEGNFRLYRWSGRAQDAAVPIATDALTGIHPEELIVVPEQDGRLVMELFSDDGDASVSGGSCKDAAVTQRSFRAVTARLDVVSGTT